VSFVIIPATVGVFLTLCRQLTELRVHCEANGGAWPTLEEELSQRAALAAHDEEEV
jgi:hypothetical protein